MDYKEKYEQALEVAKKLIENEETNIPVFYVDNIKDIFTELKESDDEKIRQRIIKLIKKSNEVGGYTLWEADEMLAWLEKQVSPQMVADAYLRGCNDTEKKLLEKQDEIKNADKFIEEEKPLLEKFKQAVYDCAWGKVTCKKEGETKEEYANRWAEHFLLMVRDWADDYIEYTIQQKLRKSYDEGKEDAIKENSPAWSEEDEKMLKSAVGAVWAADYYTYDDKQEIEEWLESLKERMTNS